MNSKISFLLLALFFVSNLHGMEPDRVKKLISIVKTHPDNPSIMLQIEPLKEHVACFEFLLGNTALHVAVKNRKYHATQTLLKLGTNVNIENLYHIRTPLHLTVSSGEAPCKKLIKLLLYHNANLDAKDYRGYTPAQVARQYSHHHIADILEARARWRGPQGDGLRSTWVKAAVIFGRNLE